MDYRETDFSKESWDVQREIDNELAKENFQEKEENNLIVYKEKLTEEELQQYYNDKYAIDCGEYFELLEDFEQEDLEQTI